MSRRDFLQLFPSLGVAGALGGCAPAAPLVAPSMPARPVASGQRRKLEAICFDLFTLFDPRSVVEVAKSMFGERAVELCDAWRVRQFEYSWLREAAGQYVDFHAVTHQALLYATNARGITLTPEQRSVLVDAYSQLEPWPDTRASLAAWQRAGLRLAPLANYSPAMLERLLAHAGLSDFFETQISTDAAKTFKPSPRAYALGESRLGLHREEIAFAAFGGWDAAGAKWFGFPTFWVNRLAVPQEQLIDPDGTGPTFTELAEFVTGWGGE